MTPSELVALLDRLGTSSQAMLMNWIRPREERRTATAGEWRAYAISLRDIFNAATLQLGAVRHRQFVCTLRTPHETRRPGNLDNVFGDGLLEGRIDTHALPILGSGGRRSAFITYEARGVFDGGAAAVDKARSLCEDAGRWAWMAGDLASYLPPRIGFAATMHGRIVLADDQRVEVEQMHMGPAGLWMHLLHNLAHTRDSSFLTTRRSSWDAETGTITAAEKYVEFSLDDDDSPPHEVPAPQWYRCALDQDVFRASAIALDLLLGTASPAEPVPWALVKEKADAAAQGRLPGLPLVGDVGDAPMIPPTPTPPPAPSPSVVVTPPPVIGVSAFARIAGVNKGTVSRARGKGLTGWSTEEDARRMRDDNQIGSARPPAAPVVAWRCPAGHSFDNSFDKCPQCGAEPDRCTPILRRAT